MKKWMKKLFRRRPLINDYKPNEEWPHTALPCYNESAKLFYMKYLIVDRLIDVNGLKLILVYKTSHRLQENKILERMWTQLESGIAIQL